jgi:hypothetical protein
MSSDDSNAVQSGRQSSDDTFSEQATASDGAQTNMTSVLDTDEDPIDNSSLDSVPEDERLDPGEGDTLSLYPSSHYPRIPSPHRTERPYGSAGPASFVLGPEM